MNWWYWTWVLYSATIAAILRGLSLWGVLLRVFGDGIARSRKRKRLQWPQPGRAPVQGMSMLLPERFWPVTGSHTILWNAPDTRPGPGGMCAPAGRPQDTPEETFRKLGNGHGSAVRGAGNYHPRRGTSSAGPCARGSCAVGGSTP